MKKTDIFGKKYYKVETLKTDKTKKSTARSAKDFTQGLVLITAEGDLLAFFASLYRHTAYLFEVEEKKFELEVQQIAYFYKVFTYFDPQSATMITCICNQTDTIKKIPLIGDENAVFQLKKNTRKNFPQQMSFQFDFDKNLSLPQESSMKRNEEEKWIYFWKLLSQNAHSQLPKIDFIIPISTRNYLTIKAMLLYLPQLPRTTYSVVNHSGLEDFDDLFNLIEIYEEQNTKVEN